MAEISTNLDPASVDDKDALRAFLRRRRRVYEPEVLDFARRVREESPHPGLRLDALNLLASAAVVRGDDAEGERLFRRALEESWGTGRHAERVACVNLAMIVARQRRLVEGFVLSRRACALTLAEGDRLGACLAHAQLAKVLLQLGDHAGFEEAVAQAVALQPEMDETVKDWVPHLLAALRAEVAVLHGDRAEADRQLARALHDPDVISDVVLSARASHLRRSGRPAEALAVVRQAQALGAADEVYTLRYQAEELLCLIELGDRAAVLRRAELCLAGLRSDGRRVGSPFWRMEVAGTVGRALADDALAREQAREAFEIAAVAALERSWEARQFFKEFPQLEQLEPEVLSVLAAHAERFRDEQREILDALRDLLCRGDESGHRRLQAAMGKDGRDDELFVAACAWCNRVRGPELAWLSLDGRPLQTGELEVTHAICPKCRSSLTPSGPSSRDSRPGGVVRGAQA